MINHFMDPFHGLIPDSDVCVGFTNPTFSWSASLLESEHHVGWLQTVGLGDMFNVLGPLDDDTATTLFELDSPAESHTTSSSESIKPPSSRPPHTGRVASGAAGHVLPRQLPHPQSWSHDPVTVIPYSGPREKSHRIRRLRPARRANALVDDKDPITQVKRHKAGGVQGSFCIFGTKQRIRSSLDENEKALTAMTRSLGACNRCRRQKIRCNMARDPLLPCQKCSRVPRSVLHQPCIRVDLLDLNLHRRGSTLNNDLAVWMARKASLELQTTNGTATFSELVSLVPTRRVVSVTQDRGVQFRVPISTFSPESGDVTWWKWRDHEGAERTMEMPPYAICDMEEAANNMRDAISRGKEEYVNGLLHAANPLCRRTFEAAFQYIEGTGSTLVSNALTFWVATRFIEHPWRVCEGDLAPFEPPYDPECPYSGIVPVTPIMDTQIDDIALRVLLIPLGQMILRELDGKIKQRKRENWFEIYLTTFIIMNNFELIFSDVLAYTSRHGLRASTGGAPSLSKGYYHACKTVLVYFHFACSGAAPLSLDLPSPRTPRHLLPFDQQAYIREMKEELGRQKDQVAGWKTKSAYTTPMYWCYQMLDKDWAPDVPHAEPIDDFTEEDFLTS